MVSRNWFVIVVALCSTVASGFVGPVGMAPTRRTPALHAKVRPASKKGFAAAPPKKPKTPAKLERERAAGAYEAAKAAGVPEYRVHCRPEGSTTWLPVGCVTVPRSESVSQAIYANKAALDTAATSAHPVLRAAAQDGVPFEYGFNLAVFPDDPVRPASVDDARDSTNPVASWIKDLTSPINAAS